MKTFAIFSAMAVLSFSQKAPAVQAAESFTVFIPCDAQRENARAAVADFFRKNEFYALPSHADADQPSPKVFDLRFVVDASLADVQNLPPGWTAPILSSGGAPRSERLHFYYHSDQCAAAPVARQEGRDGESPVRKASLRTLDFVAGEALKL